MLCPQHAVKSELVVPTVGPSPQQTSESHRRHPAGTITTWPYDHGHNHNPDTDHADDHDDHNPGPNPDPDHNPDPNPGHDHGPGPDPDYDHTHVHHVARPTSGQSEQSKLGEVLVLALAVPRPRSR